jgi:hypothetical protein
MPTECRNADLDDVILLHSRSLQTLWPNVRNGDLNAHQQSEASVERECKKCRGLVSTLGSESAFHWAAPPVPGAVRRRNTSASSSPSRRNADDEHSGWWRGLKTWVVCECFAESSDMRLYLAGVNEHAVFRIVGSKRWSVAHFLKTIQYLLEYGVRFLTTSCYCTSPDGLRRRKERNYFLFADHLDRILVPDAPRDTTA